jgi:hypothetical protein
MLVAAVVALLPNTGNAERCLAAPCPPLTGQALFADACAMLLSSRASGYRDPQDDEWLSNCAKAGSLCRETKDYIEKTTRRPAADLVCQPGGGEAVHDKKRSLSIDEVAKIPVGEISFNDACVMFAASRLSGYPDPKESELLAQCKRHPNRDFCRQTKKWIEDKSNRPVPELTCGG